MNRLVRKNVVSKWLKTKAILRDGTVRHYVPETRLLTAESLRSMLRRYGMVYVKPVSGSGGKGVMRVEQNGASRFSYQVEKTKRTFAGYDGLYRSLSMHKRKRPYLVQKGIRLLTLGGRRFDVRVMVQRNPATRVWETTGIIGRLAHPKKIVTNYHSEGTPMDVARLMGPRVGKRGIAAFKSKLSRVGLLSAKALARTYPGLSMVGADLGIDASHKPWIIELNTSPDPYLFRFLKDKRTHRKVMQYARALGRIRRRKR